LRPRRLPASSIAREFALAPMLFLPCRIEHALGVSV
jgi:hypothetical protein